MHTYFRRLVLLMLTSVFLFSFTGCFVFSFPKLVGGSDKEDISIGQLFDPEGDDDPLLDATEETVRETTSVEVITPPVTQETQPVEETQKPTEKPTEAPTEPEDPLPANPIAYGVVTGDRVNVRSGPGTNYDVEALVYENARIAIYQRDGDWGRMKDGWVSLKYVYLDGDVGPDGSVMGTVDGMTVRIRTGPGTNYNVKTVVDTGERLEILFRATFNGREWGCTKQGWICMDFVIVDGE